jgi:Cu(I)/Ag(I) efflux system membrane protein CusA/SilA
MIDRLIDSSARHRFVIVALAVAAAVSGWRSMTALPLDALPDTGDRQVIVHSTWDRSPDLIDAQVTSPIVSALSGRPAREIGAGISDYGSSFVYVIFEDGTDPYWARSRTLEALPPCGPRLPEDATTGSGRTRALWAGFSSTRSWTPPARTTCKRFAPIRIGISSTT